MGKTYLRNRVETAKNSAICKDSFQTTQKNEHSDEIRVYAKDSVVDKALALTILNALKQKQSRPSQ